MKRENKHFFTNEKGGQTFHVRYGDDDVDGGWGEDVSEANILVSEASMNF